MAAGIPGTGIGGLFYILLCVFMPFFHLFRAIKGGHKKHHIKTGITSILLSAGILLSLYGEAKLLIWLANKIDLITVQADQSVVLNTGHLSESSALTAIMPSVVMLPFIVLFTLLIIIQILRLIVHGFKRKPQVQLKREASVLPLKSKIA